jgi:hypothetical protein
VNVKMLTPKTAGHETLTRSQIGKLASQSLDQLIYGGSVEAGVRSLLRIARLGEDSDEGARRTQQGWELWALMQLLECGRDEETEERYRLFLLDVFVPDEEDRRLESVRAVVEDVIGTRRLGGPRFAAHSVGELEHLSRVQDRPHYRYALRRIAYRVQTYFMSVEAGAEPALPGPSEAAVAAE